MEKKFNINLKRFLANTCIGPSTIRNMGPEGTIINVRNYLISINLDEFFIAIKDKKLYDKFLKSNTNKLIKAAKFNGEGWGPSRKCLNIYFRTVCFNSLIINEYLGKSDLKQLNLILNNLELPLDSNSVKGLKEDARYFKIHLNENLKSERVKNLNEQLSNSLQNLAKEISQHRKVSPVNLDLYYFRKDKSQ